MKSTTATISLFAIASVILLSASLAFSDTGPSYALEPAGLTPTAEPTPPCVFGKKIDDLHAGLPGWTIHAKPRDADGPILTAVTDGAGNFRFSGLTPGWWTLWEELQAGWTPVTSPSFDVEITSNGGCVEVRFKNRQSCARDLYEPDDTRQQASLMKSGEGPRKHTLEPPTDQDWIAFDAVRGWRYVLRTQNLLGSTDTVLTLYGTDGETVLASNDDAAAGDPASEVVWTASTSGRYYAKVRDLYQTGLRGCLGYDFVLIGPISYYLPLIMKPFASSAE